MKQYIKQLTSPWETTASQVKDLFCISPSSPNGSKEPSPSHHRGENEHWEGAVKFPRLALISVRTEMRLQQSNRPHFGIVEMDRNNRGKQKKGRKKEWTRFPWDEEIQELLNFHFDYHSCNRWITMIIIRVRKRRKTEENMRRELEQVIKDPGIRIAREFRTTVSRNRGGRLDRDREEWSKKTRKIRTRDIIASRDCITVGSSVSSISVLTLADSLDSFLHPACLCYFLSHSHMYLIRPGEECLTEWMNEWMNGEWLTRNHHDDSTCSSSYLKCCWKKLLSINRGEGKLQWSRVRVDLSIPIQIPHVSVSRCSMKSCSDHQGIVT